MDKLYEASNSVFWKVSLCMPPERNQALAFMFTTITQHFFGSRIRDIPTLITPTAKRNQ